MLYRKQGFTIVELLVVIVIIAILAAVSIVSYNGLQNRAVDATVRSDLVANAKRLRMYYDTYGAPTGWGDLLQSGKVGTEFGFTGTKKSYYVNLPSAASTVNNSLSACFYRKAPSGPNDGMLLTATTKTKTVLAVMANDAVVRDITDIFNANITDTTAYCNAAGIAYGVTITGGWYMTPYIAYSSN